MLKITPYLGILVVIISIAGIWYPKLGYFIVLVFITLLAISPLKGRWFCGNLCPRGSFNDFWLGKISFKKKIPKFFRNLWLRVFIIIAMVAFMIIRLLTTQGLIDKIGMVFVIMCIATTLIAILFGIFINPRTWCTFCPMGTIQRAAGSKKYQLKFDKNLCINCNKCNIVCPMHLTVNEISHKPDCIKCGRCIEVCPKKALSF
ncbi:MAG: 4Fe-4S binding protein [Nanoarchaeota archaeon]|nr:4Fe-4S binding protein [Nanoarchaeota archaeon]